MFKNIFKRQKKTKRCPYCKNGKLKLMNADEPYNTEYLQCEKCDSTYTLHEYERKINEKN